MHALAILRLLSSSNVCGGLDSFLPGEMRHYKLGVHCGTF